MVMLNKKSKLFLLTLIFFSSFLASPNSYAKTNYSVGFSLSQASSFAQSGSGTNDFKAAYAIASSFILKKKVPVSYVKTKASSCGSKPTISCLISTTGATRAKTKTNRITSSNMRSLAAAMFSGLKTKRGVFFIYNSKKVVIVFRAGYDLKTGQCSYVKNFQYCKINNGKILSSLSGLKKAGIYADDGHTFSQGINYIKNHLSSLKNNVVIALGTNNCSSSVGSVRCPESPVTSSQVNSMISAIRAKNPKARIYFLTNYAALEWPSSNSDYSKLKSYNNDKFKEATKAHQGVYLIDWAGFVSSSNKKTYVYPDGHPTAAGSKKIGELIIKTVKAKDSSAASNGSDITILGDSMINRSNSSASGKKTMVNQEFCITGPGRGSGWYQCGSAESLMKAANGAYVTAFYY